MEFLVRFESTPPDAMPSDVRDKLKTAERARATELREAGILKKLWRVPGRRAVVGLWEAPDATVLHDALTSLPMFPWMRDTTVEPLAVHPQEK
ncbi:MAG: muconolactone Delta-isomerase [Rhodococcus sp. (in: high G+C Gram-positive bacteria)]